MDPFVNDNAFGAEDSVKQYTPHTLTEFARREYYATKAVYYKLKMLNEFGYNFDTKKFKPEVKNNVNNSRVVLKYPEGSV